MWLLLDWRYSASKIIVKIATITVYSSVIAVENRGSSILILNDRRDWAILFKIYLLVFGHHEDLGVNLVIMVKWMMIVVMILTLILCIMVLWVWWWYITNIDIVMKWIRSWRKYISLLMTIWVYHWWWWTLWTSAILWRIYHIFETTIHIGNVSEWR